MEKEELLKKLKESKGTIVLCGAWNGHVNTYSEVDHILTAKFGDIWTDLFNTPGRIDGRLLKIPEDQDVIFIGTRFGRIPDKNIDHGTEPPDTPISELNGPGGDKDLLWKQLGFQETDPGRWKKDNLTEGWEITYHSGSDILNVCNYRNDMRFTGKTPGIETFWKILDAAGIKL